MEDNPHLEKSFHQGEKPTLLKALGLAARSMSLSSVQIIAKLSEFYQPKPVTFSQERATSSQERAISSQERAISSRETKTATTERHVSPQSDSNDGDDGDDGDDHHLRESRTNTEMTCEDHMYTSALKEIGDIEGFSPTYTLNRLSLTPSKWGATAQYKRFKTFAEGTSKKAAKHSASKALWLMLGKSAIL